MERSSGATPPWLARPEPEQHGEVRLSIEGQGETAYLQAAYHFPAASHLDFFALSVLDSLLAGPSNLNMFGGGSISNRTFARALRALVDKELAVSLSGGSTTTIDPFLYYITLTIHPKRTPDDALAALDAELQRVQDELVSKDESHAPSNDRAQILHTAWKLLPTRLSGLAIVKCSQTMIGS